MDNKTYFANAKILRRNYFKIVVGAFYGILGSIIGDVLIIAAYFGDYPNKKVLIFVSVIIGLIVSIVTTVLSLLDNWEELNDRLSFFTIRTFLFLLGVTIIFILIDVILSKIPIEIYNDSFFQTILITSISIGIILIVTSIFTIVWMNKKISLMENKWKYLKARAIIILYCFIFAILARIIYYGIGIMAIPYISFFGYLFLILSDSILLMLGIGMGLVLLECIHDKLIFSRTSEHID